MKIRAKFRVHMIQRSATQETVSLSPVYSSDPENENAKWAAATPSGQITMTIGNRDAMGKFEEGKSYFIDFTEAE